MREQPLRDGQYCELSERAAAAAMPSTMLRFLGRIRAAKHAGDDAVRQSRQADSDQHAQLSMSASGVVACAMATSPDDVENRADHDDPGGTEAVGDHAGERLHGSPHEVLNCDGQRERLAAPMKVRAHRLQEETESVAQADRQRKDDALATRITVGVRQSARDCMENTALPCESVRQRSLPPGSGWSCSTSASVAISASSFGLPIRATTCDCARFQCGAALRIALAPAGVSALRACVHRGPA
jgi:hypothetical protein